MYMYMYWVYVKFNMPLESVFLLFKRKVGRGRGGGTGLINILSVLPVA